MSLLLLCGRRLGDGGGRGEFSHRSVLGADHPRRARDWRGKGDGGGGGLEERVSIPSVSISQLFKGGDNVWEINNSSSRPCPSTSGLQGLLVVSVNRCRLLSKHHSLGPTLPVTTIPSKPPHPPPTHTLLGQPLNLKMPPPINTYLRERVAHIPQKELLAAIGNCSELLRAAQSNPRLLSSQTTPRTQATTHHTHSVGKEKTPPWRAAH